MTQTMVLVERDALSHELEQVFDRQTTETLLRVLDNVASQVYASTMPRSDYSRWEQLGERIDRRLDRLSEIVEKLSEEVRDLVEAQQRNEERFIRVESDITELKTDVSVLKTDVSVLKTDVNVLKTDVSVLKTDVGHLKGDSLERKYREKAPAYFGRLIRKPRAVDMNRLWDLLETDLSEEELNDVLLLDLLVKGKSKERSFTADLYLAVEISAVVDRHDVERAQRRAALLGKAGFQAIPVVAGEDLTAGAEQEARTQKVAVLRNGGYSLWDEALASRMKTKA